MATAAPIGGNPESRERTVRGFFDRTVPAHLKSAATPPVPGVFVFEVTGSRGGVWTLDFDAVPPSCRSGAAEGADCTISLSDDDLESVLRRETDLEELFYRQRVRVEGDLNRAAGLLPLFSDATAQGIGLAALLAPFDAREFLSRHWPHEFLLFDPSLARLNLLESMAPLENVEALLETWRGTVRVFPPGRFDQLSPHVTTVAAGKLYERGFTLVFDSVDLWFPDLRNWVKNLQADLALPSQVWGKCMIYATPTGSGFNSHFDENANFAIQLRGVKRWNIAPNASVAEPTYGYRIGGHLHPELASETHAPLPTQMPDEGRFEVTLEPGAMIFLPRSWWHHTTAMEPSLSLNFTFDQPCWAEVLTKAIRSHLVRRPEWRALATGVGARDERAGAAAERAGALLAGLAAEIGKLDVPALLAEVSSPRPDPELLDLKRDWVEALDAISTTGGSPEQSATIANTRPAGRLLYDRLLLGWDNPASLEGVCQFQLDGPQGGEFYLNISPRELTYHEGRAPEPTAFVRMPEALARELALGDNVDFHDPENFQQIEAAGDDAILSMLVQMTKVPNQDAAVRFADAEARAGSLPRLSEPLRLTNPSAQQVAEALEAGMPMILRDALAGWEEAMRWTYDSIRRDFGHLGLKSTVGIGTIGEFLDALEKASPENPPYTLGSVLPDELVRYFPPPFFDPQTFGPAQIWMGSGPNQISTMLHRDSGDAYLGQLIGRKRFKMYSPEQTPYLYVSRSFNRDQPCWVNPWQPDFQRYPLFRNAFVTDFELEPGDLLIIPRGWYHTVLALERTLSVGFHREPVTDFGRMLGHTFA